jgi:hypothetical protein
MSALLSRKTERFFEKAIFLLNIGQFFPFFRCRKVSHLKAGLYDLIPDLIAVGIKIGERFLKVFGCGMIISANFPEV